MPQTSRSKTVFSFIFCLLFSTKAWSAYVYNMTKGVTEISRDIHALHMAIFWICVVIGVGVFGVMFYSIFKHRKSKGAIPAHFHENTTVEIIWTTIPLLILIAMAVPATRVLLKISNTKVDSELSIKITGHQWRWEYEYLGLGLRFISNNSTPSDQVYNRDTKDEFYLYQVDKPLVVPIGKKIRFLTTASDVIHSWWVPALGIKRDAIPGFINEAWARIDVPGTYRGQCAELCGVNHGFMPIVIIAKTEEEYEAWLKSQQSPAPTPTTPTSSQSPNAEPAKTIPAAPTEPPPSKNPVTTNPNDTKTSIANPSDAKTSTPNPINVTPSNPNPNTGNQP